MTQYAPDDIALRSIAAHLQQAGVPDAARGQILPGIRFRNAFRDWKPIVVGHQILLVEDNPINIDLLSRRLRRKGFEVSIAHNGVEALEQVTRCEPDLVLLDMGLPVLDGWATATEIRNREIRVPIIGVTAHATSADLRRMLESGCDGVHTKPIDFKKLINEMANYLEPKNDR